jgi:hypothetical protein
MAKGRKLYGVWQKLKNKTENMKISEYRKPKKEINFRSKDRRKIYKEYIEKSQKVWFMHHGKSKEEEKIN